MLMFCVCKLLDGGVPLHELIEDRKSDGAAGLVEEDHGDEKAERVMSETFLHEAEGRRGEGWVRDATYILLRRGFALGWCRWCGKGKVWRNRWTPGAALARCSSRGGRWRGLAGGLGLCRMR